MTTRRKLSFSNLTEVMPEVDRLLGGYSPVGQWSLGQVCQHLATTLRFSIEGWPTRAPWLVRRTIGRIIGRRILSTGLIREGVKLSAESGMIPRPDLDDRAEAEALRGAIHFYQGYADAFPEHAFFGPLSRHDWDRLHCLHCAHHLSFLQPASKEN
jgi:Protein of unknown function (DUF1569)